MSTKPPKPAPAKLGLKALLLAPEPRFENFEKSIPDRHKLRRRRLKFKF